MAKIYQGPEWVRPTDADLENYISIGRALQREAMREAFYGLFSASKKKINTLRQGLSRFRQVSSAS
jgi:hypothetical protein